MFDTPLMLLPQLNIKNMRVHMEILITLLFAATTSIWIYALVTEEHPAPTKKKKQNLTRKSKAGTRKKKPAFFYYKKSRKKKQNRKAAANKQPLFFNGSGEPNINSKELQVFQKIKGYDTWQG